MSFRFPKKEKLKQKRLFELLFNKGKSKYRYPVKMLWAFKSDSSGAQSLQIGVSAPKRIFPKAVDRNRLKRQMREAIRLHKAVIPVQERQLIILFIYTSKKQEAYLQIEQSISFLTKHLQRQLSQFDAV